MSVHIEYYVDRSAQDGTNDPASGTVECAPIKRRYVDHHVVTPQSFTARLVDGLADLKLDAPSADWCWQITERVNRGKRRFVTFTDPGEGVVLYADDLIDVDPATFEPDAEPEAAWWAAVAELTARYSTDIIDNGDGTWTLTVVTGGDYDLDVNNDGTWTLTEEAA